jgi:tetratricopeptide (TPR) repeat protein
MPSSTISTRAGYNGRGVIVALFVPLLFVAAAENEESDRPYVEILQSTGAIDGPSEGGIAVPRWERVRIELRVENRLAVEVRDLEVELALVSASGAKESEALPIPGWSFRETFEDRPLDPLVESYLRILRELPARRTSPPAEEIAYRATIKSYHLSVPDLDTAIRLLGSSHDSDQMAALKSYELAGTGVATEVIGLLGKQLATAISALPEEPTASDALRMLFAVRAIGTLGDASQIRTLLELPGVRDGREWARAVVDLATRMVGASEAEEPRLRVLPSWARERSLFTVRAQDTLEDAVRDAILRMGDLAVPALLAEAHLGSVPGVRARAQRLLHGLGRATVRSQLSVRDRSARLEVIAVLGAIGSPEPVPALVEMLRARDAEQKSAAMKAIQRIGVPAIPPLVASLGTKNDEPILAALIGLGNSPALAAAAARYGIEAERGDTPEKIMRRLQQHLLEEQRARLVQEIERALELGREGAYTESFERLDRVFTQDAELYMTYAKPIARIYLLRGQRLVARGDYDAAVSTLRTGQSISRLPETETLLLTAQLALARGYVELGDLDKAQEVIGEADPELTVEETRILEAKLLSLRADHALSTGDYGRARTLIDRARTLKLRDAELDRADRRLLFAENSAIVVVLALLVPAALLTVILLVRKRVQAARLRRLAMAIDRG